MPEVPGSILGADVQFSFFFLVEKKIDDCENAKMAPTVYETETCYGSSATWFQMACSFWAELNS